jgi:hypothetical protein
VVEVADNEIQAFRSNYRFSRIAGRNPKPIKVDIIALLSAGTFITDH